MKTIFASSLRVKQVLLLLLMTIPALNAQNSKVTEHRLSNGLTVWLNEDHSQNKVTGTLVVRIGAKDSPNTGIPHYFEHIMFKGTDKIGTVDYEKEKPLLDEIKKQYSLLSQTSDPKEIEDIQKRINTLSIEAAKYAIPNEFTNLISKYGGSGLNAYTSWDRTAYFNTFSPQYLEHWCYLNSERLINPVFRLFQSELETVYEEKNMYSDAMGREAMDRVIARVAAPHPYQYTIIGSTENLKKPDLAKMEEFYNTYYVAGNMGLILCGSFSEKEALPVLEKTFGRIRPGNPPRPVCEQPRPFNGVEQFSVKFPIPFIQGRVLIWRGVPSGHEDEAAMEVAIRIFSNKGETGLLDKLYRTGKVMTAGAQFNNMNDMGAAAIFFVPKLPFGTISSAQKEATKILEQVKRGEFGDDLFQQLKNEMLQDYTTLLEDLTSRGRTYASLFAAGEHWSSHHQKLERVRSLTKQDVVDVVNRYFTGNYLQVSKKTGRYPKDRIQKPPFAPLPLHNKGAKSEFARFLETLPVGNSDLRFLDFETDAKPVSVIEGNDLVKLYTGANPINDLFTLKLNYQVGVYERPVLEQVAFYLSLLGTSRHGSDQFKDKLQQLGATLSFEAYNETFTINVRGFDAQLKPTLELLGHFLTDVKGEKKALKKLVENKKISRKAILKSSQDMGEALSEWVRFGDKSTYSTQLSLKEIKALKADRLVGELKSVLSKECDIHYVGNESAEQVASLLKQYLPLDKVEERTANPIDLDAVVPEKPYLYILPDKKSTQTIIKGYLFAPPFESDKERAYLELYRVYLGGGMNSLLFQEVRELRSLAYGAYSVSYLPSKRAQTSKATILEAHLSTQGDKATDALLLLDSLLSVKPEDAGRIEYAQEALRSAASNNYPTFRKKSEMAVRAVRRGFDEDPALWLLNRMESVDRPEFARYISEKLQQSHPRAYVVVGNPKKLDMKALAKLGEVVVVDPKKIYR